MTLTELIKSAKLIASNLALVNSVYDGDIYDNFAEHNIKYGAFNVDVESVERADVGLSVVLYLYYADRLLQNKSNALALKDDGVSVLQSVINGLKRENGVMSIGTITFTPFEQKFDDYLAGAYARVTVNIKSDVANCNMDGAMAHSLNRLIEVDGVYDVVGYDTVTVDAEKHAMPKMFMLNGITIDDNALRPTTNGVVFMERATEDSIVPTYKEEGDYCKSSQTLFAPLHTNDEDCYQINFSMPYPRRYMEWSLWYARKNDDGTYLINRQNDWQPIYSYGLHVGFSTRTLKNMGIYFQLRSRDDNNINKYSIEDLGLECYYSKRNVGHVSLLSMEEDDEPQLIVGPYEETEEE